MLSVIFCFMVPASARSSSLVCVTTAVRQQGGSGILRMPDQHFCKRTDSLLPSKIHSRQCQNYGPSSRSAFPNVDPDFAQQKGQAVTAANIIAYGAPTTRFVRGLVQQSHPQSGFLHTISDRKNGSRSTRSGMCTAPTRRGKVCMEMWRWTGIDRKKRIWMGGLGGIYQTIIETLWMASAQTGVELGAILGPMYWAVACLLEQELAWDEQKSTNEIFCTPENLQR